MNDDQFFLANAYLDGELTAAEREIAESDPVVMTAVEELRAVRDVVRDVEPPSATARDAAIAAAMAHFGASTASATESSPAPIPFRPRPSYAKYLAVAAGVVGVGLFGVAVANLGGDDDASEDMATDLSADEPTESRMTEDQPLVATEDESGGATAEALADEPADEPAMDVMEVPAEEPAAEPAEEPAEEPSVAEAGERPVLTPGQVLTTPQELGSFGTDLLEQVRAGNLGPTPNHACPVDNVLGEAEYLVGDEVVPVLVAVDEPAGIVLAFDEDDCGFVVDGPLYQP
ncbi:MAG: hypothetical protein ACLGHQ_12810 [Acidimicrobiia bacterium]